MKWRRGALAALLVVGGSALVPPGPAHAARAYLGEIESLPGLYRMLRSEPRFKRATGAWMLEVLGPRSRSLAEPLVAALADPAREVRREAACALVAIGPDAVSPLVAALASTNPVQKVGVARVLGALGADARSTLPVLEGLLEEERSDLRHAAWRALRRIRGPHYQHEQPIPLP